MTTKYSSPEENSFTTFHTFTILDTCPYFKFANKLQKVNHTGTYIKVASSNFDWRFLLLFDVHPCLVIDSMVLKIRSKLRCAGTFEIKRVSGARSVYFECGCALFFWLDIVFLTWLYALCEILRRTLIFNNNNYINIILYTSF